MKYRMSNCIALGVPDKEAAARFYQETMDFERVKDGPGWIEMKTGPLRIFFCSDDVMEPAFDLEVDSLEVAIPRLEAAGCVKEDLVPNEVFMRTPFGHLFAITPKD
ncbi:MAG: VOC family protein [Fimbriimonadaceae bacterium]|nr:VOC family protein [Fimbriimonadaceae bacterium]